jgi:hypothetical protein
MADNDRLDGLLGGSRHYTGKGLGDIGMWHCPSCNAENTGPLDKGCTVCGAGSAPARHVGVPPPPRRRGTSPLQGRQLDENGTIAFSTPSTRAFHEWCTATGADPNNALLRTAWETAIAWYREYLRDTAANAEDPQHGVDIQMIPVPRELLVDVLKQLENTVDLPETDSQSPELLSLINRIRELTE